VAFYVAQHGWRKPSRRRRTRARWLDYLSDFSSTAEWHPGVAAFERPRRVRLEGSNGMVVSEDDIAITPVAGGVRVTYDANLRLPIYLRSRARIRRKPLTTRSSRR